MKKLLLSIISVAAMSFAANADTTINFADKDVWAPDGVGLENVPYGTSKDALTTATVQGVEFGFYNCNVVSSEKNGTINSTSALFLKGKSTNADKKGYVTLKLTKDCTSMTLTTPDGNNITKNGIVSVYAGETCIKENLALDKLSENFTITIPKANQAAGTVYKIIVTNNYNPQIAQIVLTEPTAEPSLTTDISSVNLYTVKGQTASAKIIVTAANITDAIVPTATLEGIKFDKASYTADEAAEGITVKYSNETSVKEEGMITFTAGALTANVTANCYSAAQAGTKEDPLTVAEVLALNSNCAGEYWVTGTIHEKTAANGKDGIIGEATENAKSNIIIKDEAGNMIPVELKSGEHRDALNIVDNANHPGKTVKVCGNLINYFSVPGVKNVSDHVLGATNGIDAIVTDEAAEAEYYNLQGVRVAAPESGLYIVRRGNKVTKELVK